MLNETNNTLINSNAEATDVVITAEIDAGAVEQKVDAPARDAANNESTADTENKVIDLTDGKAAAAPTTIKGSAPKTPPTMKTPKINFDVFIPRVKALRGNREVLSDEEIVGLALNKLTCDSYKSLKGVENTPAIACWLYLYNTVEGTESGEPDYKLAKAICNLKKDFPSAMKYMLEQIKKKGEVGYDHSEIFEYVYKYYFTKEKSKKGAKATSSKSVKTDNGSAKKKTPEKETAAKAKAKKEVKKDEKNEEPLQLSLLM